MSQRRQISSVQFSHSVVSISLWPHESQHARPPCPSPTPGVHSDSCPSSQWCHPFILFIYFTLIYNTVLVSPYISMNPPRVYVSSQPSHPLSSPFPPAPNPSQHQSLFQWATLHMRWPKYWSFSFTIIPSKEHPGLISFRMDLLDFLAVQGTFKSVL